MTEPDGLTRLAESYLDLRWHLDPVDGSGAGGASHDDRLGTFDADSVRQHVAALRALMHAIEEFDAPSLADEVDRTALLYQVRLDVHRYGTERPHVRDPGFWVGHALEGLYQLLTVRDRPEAARARAVAARLRAVPRLLDEARATLCDCPVVLVEAAQDVADAGVGLVDDVVEAFAGAGVNGGGPAEAAARDALTAFRGHLASLLRDGGDGHPAAAGEATLNFRLQCQHAVPATPPELLRYGVQLVQDVDRALTTLAERLAPGRAWPDVMDALRDAHPDPDDLVPAYEAEMARARAFVREHDLVTVPDGALEVRATPGYLRPVIPLAAYLPPGPLSADRTGRFFVSLPTGDAAERAAVLRDHCTHEIPGTALHEGYPGHHLHFLALQAQPRVVRRFLTAPLTVEGWALYCEEMMGEEGFYRSVEERFFQQVALLWRALRVVLDVGLHTGTLDVEAAVRLLQDRLHFSRAHAVAEVRRTAAEPGYQLAYAVGRRELFALRDVYRARMGAAYTLRGFHDAVLGFGGLPVSLIRWGLELDG